MHPLIEAKPEWQQIQKEKAQIAKGKEAFHQRRRKIEDKYAAELEKHRAAVDKAMREGTEPPSKPVPPELVGDARFFLDEHQKLVAMEREFLVANQESLEAELVERLNQETEAARPCIDEIQKVAAGVNELVQTIQQIRQAARPGAETGVRRGPVTASTLLHVLSSGASFVEMGEAEASMHSR